MGGIFGGEWGDFEQGNTMMISASSMKAVTFFFSMYESLLRFILCSLLIHPCSSNPPPVALPSLLEVHVLQRSFCDEVLICQTTFWPDPRYERLEIVDKQGRKKNKATDQICFILTLCNNA